jgi:hypothetical protein
MFSRTQQLGEKIVELIYFDFKFDKWSKVELDRFFSWFGSISKDVELVIDFSNTFLGKATSSIELIKVPSLKQAIERCEKLALSLSGDQDLLAILPTYASYNRTDLHLDYKNNNELPTNTWNRGLNKLVLIDTKIGDISGLTKLKSLKLDGESKIDLNDGLPKSLEHLVTTTNDASIIEAASNCKLLKSAYLLTTTNSLKYIFGTLKELKDLELIGCFKKMTDYLVDPTKDSSEIKIDIGKIYSAPKLEYLTLKYFIFDNIEALNEFPNLRILDFEGKMPFVSTHKLELKELTYFPKFWLNFHTTV